MKDLQAFQKQLAADIDAIREMQRRQPGCPVEDCSVCRANAARVEASERVIRMALALPKTAALLDCALPYAEGECASFYEGGTRVSDLAPVIVSHLDAIGLPAT